MLSSPKTQAIGHTHGRLTVLLSSGECWQRWMSCAFCSGSRRRINVWCRPADVRRSMARTRTDCHRESFFENKHSYLKSGHYCRIQVYRPTGPLNKQTNAAPVAYAMYLLFFDGTIRVEGRFHMDTNVYLQRFSSWQLLRRSREQFAHQHQTIQQDPRSHLSCHETIPRMAFFHVLQKKNGRTNTAQHTYQQRTKSRESAITSNAVWSQNPGTMNHRQVCGISAEYVC